MCGFKNIFNQARKANIIPTDKGSEFRNRWVKAFFATSDVKHYVTHNETNANNTESDRERVNRTLKEMM